MRISNHYIQIISAPSILGLKPGGVEKLPGSLLSAGLTENLNSKLPVINLPVLNELYSDKRDKETNCLNSKPVREFSLTLGKTVTETLNKNHFAFVLGGDCSILIGIMQTLKEKGTYGLIFMDAHADFYEPEKSVTGEVADMDLAIVTGRGPDFLTNINGQHPYVKDENVIHIGQRDWEETKKYGSQDIKETMIKNVDNSEIEKKGIKTLATELLQHINKLKAEGIWIHYDTDVLSDEINPAVDYRLPGGISFEQVEYLLKNFLTSGKIIGISITIFNPDLDKTGSISKNFVDSIGRAFNLKAIESYSS